MISFSVVKKKFLGKEWINGLKLGALVGAISYTALAAFVINICRQFNICDPNLTVEQVLFMAKAAGIGTVAGAVVGPPIYYVIGKSFDKIGESHVGKSISKVGKFISNKIKPKTTNNNETTI